MAETKSPMKLTGSPISNGDKCEILEGRIMVLQQENTKMRDEIVRRNSDSQDWQAKYNNLYVQYRKVEQSNSDLNNRFAKDRSDYQLSLHNARMETQRAQQHISQLQYDLHMLQQRYDEQASHMHHRMQPPAYSATPLQTRPISIGSQTESPLPQSVTPQDGPNVGREHESKDQSKVPPSKSKKEAATEQAKNEAVINHLQKIVQSKEEEIARLRKAGPKGCNVAIQHSWETESRSVQTLEALPSAPTPKHGGPAQQDGDPIFRTMSSLPTSRPIQVKIVPQAHQLLAARWSDEPFDAELSNIEPVLHSRQSSNIVDSPAAASSRTQETRPREPIVVVAAPKKEGSLPPPQKTRPSAQVEKRANSTSVGRWSGASPAQGQENNAFRTGKR